LPLGPSGIALPQSDAQDSTTMPKQLPPHLVPAHNGEKKRCSVCHEEFTADAKPSLSKAFAQHVREKHQRSPEHTLRASRPSQN
jgi:hypothetical protein